ncbi:MAG: LuxR C-terminal-related transcriptional regulator [Chloroflexota bacterium]|jgi:DNA-binding NarL/FixJ family response regulator|nr:response regulator transcription factor [Lentimicrobium sp.]
MFRNVIIVEEHHIVSDSIAWILSDAGLEFSFIPVHSMHRAQQVLSEIKTDLVIFALNLTETDIKSFFRNAKDLNQSVKTILITSTSRKTVMEQLFHSPIDGLLVKSHYTSELADAVNEVMSGGRYMGNGIADILNGLKLNNHPTLTKREKEVLLLIAEGHTNPEISKKLFISHFTVDSHRKNLLSKFKTKNTATLIKTAIVMGIIE